MQTPTNQAPSPSYFGFIWNTRQNRLLLLLGAGSSAAMFLIFKWLYPFPDFFGDSYSYIYAAMNHLDINTWPIGYSKFLSAVHTFTRSGAALVAVQYFSMQLAALHFLFTVLYFFQVNAWQRTALAIFLFINPLTLYLCNTINSDALFGTLSLLWITELIWIANRPKFYRLIIHATLLFLCFTVRNNAYYYPAVAAAAILLTGLPAAKKATGIALPLLLIGAFVLFTREAAFKLTGTRQFSLFTGWQLANNALYIYDQVDVDSSSLPTKEAKDLNRHAIQYFRRVNPGQYRESLESYVGNFFIRQPEAPLKQYYASHYRFGKENDNIVNWAKASEVFEPFGKSVILHHPIAYCRFFIVPNTWHYFIPPLSHLGLYNYGIKEIDPIAQQWFGYKSNKVHCISPSLQGQILLFYIGLFLLCNVMYLWNTAKFAALGGFKDYRGQPAAALLVILAFAVLNFLFSISSTVNILRYQYVPMIVLLTTGVVLTGYVGALALKPKRRYSGRLRHTL